MEKKIVALLTTLVTAALFLYKMDNTNSSLVKQQYKSWKLAYRFTYNEAEDQYRFRIFLQNWQEVQRHNTKIGKTYQKGINQFSAMTLQEFNSKYLSQFQSYSIGKVITQSQKSQENYQVDWVQYGAVSSVKDQGQCAASYAFSAVGVIEGRAKIYQGIIQQFSVQQLIDCTDVFGNKGCISGDMTNCFIFTQKEGILSQSQYPYTTQQGKCKQAQRSFTYKTRGFNVLNDCSNVANALMARPLSVAVDARKFKDYQSGVFDNCQTQLNLGVLLVGVNNSYWTLKNSWGINWGQKGYIKISKGNTCGVCMAASYAF